MRNSVQDPVLKANPNPLTDVMAVVTKEKPQTILLAVSHKSRIP